MIDCPGAKVLQHRCTQRGQNERKPRRRLIGETACEPCDASKKDKEEGNRPQRDDEVFRPTARQHDLRSSDEHRERQVDETRPVHHHAVRRVEPVRGEIKPALDGQEVTHLHESHGIVGRETVVASPACEQVCRGDGAPNNDEKHANVGSRW